MRRNKIVCLYVIRKKESVLFMKNCFTSHIIKRHIASCHNSDNLIEKKAFIQHLNDICVNQDNAIYMFNKILHGVPFPLHVQFQTSEDKQISF